MDHQIPLFAALEIETRSTCNRFCKGCLRNSLPDRDRARPWFQANELPAATIEQILRESLELGFQGPLVLQHYNEPLQDSRIADLGLMAKRMGIHGVFACTNGDLLTEALAGRLDGVFDQLQVALYMDEPVKSQRQRWMQSLFSRTSLYFTGGGHIPTHFSPAFDVEALATQNRTHPCNEPLKRLIINHRGDMLLCCDDMVGHFGLGNIRDHSVEALWFSEVHQRLVLGLQAPGGRFLHPHCQSCPRP